MAKSDVNGDSTNEVFKWLKAEKAGILGLTRIKVRFLAPLITQLLMYAYAVEFREVPRGQGGQGRQQMGINNHTCVAGRRDRKARLKRVLKKCTT